MMRGGNRGLAYPYGEWQDEIESCSPSAIALQSQGPLFSGKSTKAPSKKITIADYKKLRKDGTFRSITTNGGETRSRASSIASPEIRDCEQSSDTAQDSKTTEKLSKKEGSELLRAQLADYKVEARRLAEQNLNSSNLNGPHTVNRNGPIPSSRLESNRQTIKPTLKSPIRTKIKHPLPPRPQSPQRINDTKLPLAGLRQAGRSIDLQTSSKPAQRQTKDDDRTNLSPTTRDSDTRRPRNVQQPKSTLSQSMRLHSARPPTSLSDSQKNSASKTKNTKPSPINLAPIPPLLSPLPDDLDDSTEFTSQSTGLSHNKRRKLSSSPSNKGQNSTWSGSKSTYTSLKKRSGSTSPVFVHPPLLSPDLPPIVEKELSRLQKKNSNLINAESRNEVARLPDTPGVARKNMKIGLPLKRTMDTIKTNISSKSKPAVTVLGPNEVKKSFVVKIKYKKRRAKDIERILRITPKVSTAQFRAKEVEQLTVSQKKIENMDKGTSLSKKKLSKKRTPENTEVLSSLTKRAKLQDTVAVKPQSSKDPLKSPTNTVLSRTNTLTTPRKSDTKGIKNRKIPSSDSNCGNSPTVSTPAPVEKRTFSGSTIASNSTKRNDVGKYESDALLLKRKMDSEFKREDVKARENLSDHDTQIGLCTGIECLLAYYSAFSNRKDRRPSDQAGYWESTMGLLDFVVRKAEPFLLLRTLAAQLNALVKEELHRSYLEHISIVHEAPSELLEKIVRNSQSRDRYWALAKRGNDALKKIGFADSIVGPWTSWRDGRDYFMGVLTKYESQENLGWKPTF